MQGNYTQIIFLVVIVAAFYLLIIRPQQQRTKQQQDMISSLRVGTEVMTVGGMFGTIVEITDDRILVEVYDGTQLEVAKRAIAQVVTRDTTPADAEEPEVAEGDAEETTPAEKDVATDD